jgi:hypothetical protein
MAEILCLVVETPVQRTKMVGLLSCCHLLRSSMVGNDIRRLNRSCEVPQFKVEVVVVVNS